MGQDLNEYLLAETNKLSINPNLEIKDICARYATDVIASCAFGIQANSIKNPESEFRCAGRKIFNFTIHRSLEFSSVFFLPEIVPYLRFKVNFYPFYFYLCSSSIITVYPCRYFQKNQTIFYDHQ